jgi:hypothetical protein
MSVADRHFPVTKKRVGNILPWNMLARWDTATRQKALDGIRNRPLLETRAEEFIRTVSLGTVSTNTFRRRIHNFALDMNWPPIPLPPKPLASEASSS